MKNIKIVLLGLSLSLIGNVYAANTDELISNIESDEKISSLNSVDYLEVMDFVEDNAEVIADDLKNEKDMKKFKEELLDKNLRVGLQVRYGRHHRGGRIGHGRRHRGGRIGHGRRHRGGRIGNRGRRTRRRSRGSRRGRSGRRGGRF